MYAAAGGASLASRQARQRQRQMKKKEHQVKAQQRESKPLQAKQFHNYTDSPPPPIVPKLSRVERGTLKPPEAHDRRHSTSNYPKEHHRSRHTIRESPSISIPVQNHHQPQHLPLTPTTLVQLRENSQHSLHRFPSLQSQLPQIYIPPDADGKLERRCSFVRQVEEMQNCPEGGGVLDRCNHICNFEIKEKLWDNNHTQYYCEYERDPFGSLDYPFSECSQGRAAWQERERGRRYSISEEARQHRIKQSEAHHRWMKKNRIHDSTYGGGSDDDFFNVYHQSAAANALLYVGLGTTAIGSVIFCIGTGEKGFKTLELRMIGPTLVACGLLCCLIRILLCACPSSCFRKKTKTRLPSDSCTHSLSRYPLTKSRDNRDYAQIEHNSLRAHKKKVSIVPPNHSLPSTSTSEFKEFAKTNLPEDKPIPKIELPECDTNLNEARPIFDALPAERADDIVRPFHRSDTIIELENLEMYDAASVSSNDSDNAEIDDLHNKPSKLQRDRQPVNLLKCEKKETSLSVVIERSDNSESSDDRKDANIVPVDGTERQSTHSGIVLSPAQLGQ